MANGLFVVNAIDGSSQPTNAGEIALKALMESGGHTIACRAHNNADKTATGFDFVVLSSNTTSGNLTGYASVTVPVMNLAHATWDTEFNLFTGGTSAVSTTTATEVTDALGANPVTIFSVGSNARYVSNTNMAGSYTIRNRYNNISSTSVAAWSFPSGGTLADGVSVAPGARMASFPLNESVANLTVAGQNLFLSLLSSLVSSDTTPPTAPTALSTSVVSDDVTLSWTLGTDNVAVDHQEVHRSTSSGFTPGPGTAINSLVAAAATTYNDNNLADGTYYYKVIAVDSAGNKSPASNEASAIVSAVAPPPSGYFKATNGEAVDLLRYNGSSWE